MLVLTLKKDNHIKIGDNIIIRLGENNPINQVKIGIDAPKEINIARSDAKKRIKYV